MSAFIFRFNRAGRCLLRNKQQLTALCSLFLDVPITGVGSKTNQRKAAGCHKNGTGTGASDRNQDFPDCYFEPESSTDIFKILVAQFVGALNVLKSSKDFFFGDIFKNDTVCLKQIPQFIRSFCRKNLIK